MFRTFMKRAAICLLVSILLETLVFNHRALFSMCASEQKQDVFWSGEGYIAAGKLGHSGYVYVGIGGKENAQEEVTVPVTFSVFIKDEGNSDFYEVGNVTLLPAIEKSKYLKIHSYGEITGIHIVPDEESASVMQITDIVSDARVPWAISPVRLLAVFAALVMAYLLRPGSPLYERRRKEFQECSGILILVLINILLFGILVRSNPTFWDPVWSYHRQYQELAVSLSHGSVTINDGKEVWLEELGKLDNPYDTHLRREVIDGVDNVWDTCYYEGNFYVYFGIVPVLLFYLPYYLLFGSAFPTWVGVFIAGSFAVGGVYYLLAKIRRRWFSETPYVWYLILAVIMSNGMQLACAMLRADFYYLPIVTALAFSLWGIGFVLAATERPDRKGNTGRLALGALCLALTAGCRPQFLVGSFLILPVLWQRLSTAWRENQKRDAVKCLATICVPYLAVAVGVMYYNVIRFGSVFDFGANYNLTTNDMTRRGFQVDRLWDGFFMYLFQAPNWKSVFPFADITGFSSEYLGEIIRDWTYGGAFLTHMILWALVGIFFVRKQMKEKGALGFTLLSLGMGLVVIAADTEMAGILNRYYTDFLWLLLLPAMIVLFQLWESCKDTGRLRWLVVLVLLVGTVEILYELGIAVRGSGIMSSNAYRYFMLKALFS